MFTQSVKERKGSLAEERFCCGVCVFFYNSISFFFELRTTLRTTANYHSDMIHWPLAIHNGLVFNRPHRDASAFIPHFRELDYGRQLIDSNMISIVLTARRSLGNIKIKLTNA